MNKHSFLRIMEGIHHTLAAIVMIVSAIMAFAMQTNSNGGTAGRSYQMNRSIYAIAIALVTVMFTACSTHTPNLNPIDRLVSDTGIYEVDTVYNNVNIDGEEFSIKILRDKSDEHLHKFDTVTKQNCETPPISMVITDKSGKVIYFRKLVSEYLNVSYSLFKVDNKPLSGSGKLYFAIDENGCGSGTWGPVYLIDYKQNDEYIPLKEEAVIARFGSKISGATPKQKDTSKRKDIILTTVFEQNESEHAYYNKNDNQILITRGKWEDGESHFDAHRQHIILLSYHEGEYHEEDLGITKLKYGDLEEKPEEPLRKMYRQEPAILKHIHVDDFLN